MSVSILELETSHIKHINSLSLTDKNYEKK